MALHADRPGAIILRVFKKLVRGPLQTDCLFGTITASAGAVPAPEDRKGQVKPDHH